MAAVDSRQRAFDGLAIGASALCLLHCLILPLMLIVLPTLAAILVVPEWFHLWALALALPTSLLALWSGYRRHRSIKPAAIVLPGLALLALGVFVARAEWVETLLTVGGAVALTIGHALNWRELRVFKTVQGDGERA